MELKRPRQTSWMRSLVGRMWDRRTRRVLVILSIVSLYTGLVFAFGYYLHRSGFSFGQTLRSIKDDVGLVPKRMQAILSRPEMEHITIDIQHEDFMRLAYQREIALTSGILTASNDDFVPATISHNNESVEVELRLKGDSTDHLNTDKWSYRIKVKGDHTLFGMKQFSIQHPKTRNYLYEWIFHQALRREGLVALRYEFIKVTLNGKDLGVYALEEHFEKRLVENSQSREGPIVRFNEDPRWAEEASQHSYLSRDYIVFNSFLPTDIDTYQTGKMLSDPASYAQHMQAIYLLEAFRRGELKTSDVFDVQKLARLFAIADLTGAQHAINWANLRFYYNPITSRLEPIGFDGDSGKHIQAISVGLSPLVDPIYLDTVFSDLLFFKEYVRTLERIAEPAYLNSLLAELDDDLKRNLDIIHTEFPDFSFSERVLYENQQFIKKVLTPTKALHAYYRGATENYVELELGNIQSMPIEVLSVSYQDSVLIQPDQPIVLRERPVSYLEPLIECKLRTTETVDYRTVRFAFPDGFTWSEDMVQDLKVNYRLLGTSQTQNETVIPWSYLDLDFLEKDLIRLEPNAHAFDFLVTDEATGQILVTPGTWSLDQSLIIPSGYRVIARQGTQLNLSNSATILSYSPLEFIGSEEEPIVIQSTDSTGQGIVVMNADETSILEHVTFSNLANPSQGGWQLTGAVTFYESPVGISHSQFIDSRSEDALNIVRSEFSIDNTLFTRTMFDAIDADFSTGRIMDSSFFTLGNDAIDISGSVIEIQDIFIDGSSDKGLSVGEKSQMTANHVEIKHATIAVASKDSSYISLQDLSISESEIGLTAYQKKSEFGPASMEVNGLEMAQVNTPYLVEVRSRVVVDRETMEASHEHVYETLYGGE